MKEGARAPMGVTVAFQDTTVAKAEVFAKASKHPNAFVFWNWGKQHASKFDGTQGVLAEGLLHGEKQYRKDDAGNRQLHPRDKPDVLTQQKDKENDVREKLQ